MKILLLESVKSLGVKGEIVAVSRGYAFNFLIPKKMAEMPTKQNEEKVNSARLEISKRKTKLRQQSLNLAKKLDNLVIELMVNKNDQGTLFEGVKKEKIIKALKDKGINIEASFVNLIKPIKAIGNYEIPVLLPENIKAVFKVIIK